MTSRVIHKVDDEIVYDNGDPDRDEYDPAALEPPAAERIGALESRLDAVAALAEKANATATEVAAAAKPTR